MSPSIRILIIDDHPIVRDGLQAVLETQPDFKIIGEAGNGEQGLQAYQTLQPDLVLLDLEMPVLDGLGVLRRLPEQARVLVLTVFDTDERIVSAIRAGARGYLLKDSPREQIFQAIRLIYTGGTSLPPLALNRLFTPQSETLTQREAEILQKVAAGLTNKEIAAQSGITERTVKFHVSAILAKMGASNRTEAIHLARQQGWLN